MYFVFAASVSKGFDCVIVSSIPVGAGLSSSAAIEVASYTLLEALFNSPSSRLDFAYKPAGISNSFIFQI